MRIRISIFLILLSGLCYGQELNLSQLEKAPSQNMFIRPGIGGIPEWRADTLITLGSVNLRDFNGRWQYQDKDSAWKYFGSGNNNVDLSGYYTRSQSDNLFELLGNKVTSFQSPGSPTLFPTTKAVVDYINAQNFQVAGNYEVTNNKSASLSSPNNLQYPTTQAVADGLATKQPVGNYELSSNKSTSIGDSSDTRYPTDGAVKRALASIPAGTSGISALTGDVIASGPGSASATVNTINGITRIFYDPISSIQTQLNNKQPLLGYTPVNLADSGTKYVTPSQVYYTSSIEFVNGATATDTITIPSAVGKTVTQVYNSHLNIPVITSGTPDADHVRFNTATGGLKFGTPIPAGGIVQIFFRNPSVGGTSGATGDASSLQGYSASQLLDRSNQTGTQTASTISDFQTSVSSNTTVTANATAIAGKLDKYPGTNTQTSSYTLALNDAGAMVYQNTATASIITIPTNASVAFPLNTEIVITQGGIGQITFTPSTGVTINSADGKTKTRVQYSTATIKQISTNNWLLAGDISN